MRTLVACLALAVLGSAPVAQTHEHAPGDGHDHAQDVQPAATASERTSPWPAEVIELFESLPVQDGGRLKPVRTWASFTLLQINGKRSLTTPAGERIGSSEWALDVLFFPEVAEHYGVFLVENPEVIDSLGLEQGEKRARDRYSFGELLPGLERLFALAHDISQKPDAEQSVVEEQLVTLATNVNTYLALQRTESLAIAPPIAEPGVSADEWWTPAEILQRALRGDDVPAAHTELLVALQTLGRARSDTAAFETELRRLNTELRASAALRGDLSSLDLELTYYRTNPLRWSLIAFVFAFLATAFGWLRPKHVALPRAGLALAATGTLLLAVGIVMRCMIRGRPPVSTLYETVLFVTAIGTLVALFLEIVGRRRIALAAAATFGMVGLFVANGYETLDGRDTMPSLVAVLDTNFWLATHVTAITIGYAAGMLAALLASLYLVAKLVTPRAKLAERQAGFRALGRMAYGVLAFALVFSVVGTLLGGIWANDSWGRFWGWDPKENGALLIVLSQIAILHARRGGYLRETGVCMATAFSGTIIAFSWWGVNLLGVGLHSYGFTRGVHTGLWTYYLVQWFIVGLGAWVAVRERAARNAAKSASSGTSEAEPVLRNAA